VLYDHPLNLFVAGFIGSPAMNLIQATLERSGDGLVARLGEGVDLEIAPELCAARPALNGYVGREVVVGIRPEHLEDAAVAGDAPANRRIRGTVTLREALGSEIMIHLTAGARPAVTDETRELAADIGVEGLEQTEHEVTLVGRFSSHSQLRPGDAAEAVVDTTALHFFDPDTGLGIYDNAGEGART
jgi:multiple sugar transport system ATP-binding protein